MKNFFRLAVVQLFATTLALLPVFASAQQSNPGFVYGQVPSAAQWNSYFSGKLDYNANGLSILYGGTSATTQQSAINNLAGATTSGNYLRGNGTNVLMSTIQAGDVPGVAGGTLGSILYQSAANTTAFLAGNTTTTPQFLTSTGTGAAAQIPTYTSSSGTGNVVLTTSPTISTPTLNTPTILGHATIEGVTPTGATGTGNLVFGTSPTLSTPTLNTPTFNAVATTGVTGTGNIVLATSPTMSTPTLNTPTISNATITAVTVNGIHLTTGTGTLTLGAKTLTASNSITLAGTDSTTMTFPSTSATIARTDTDQTFSGIQTFSGTIAGTALSTYLASPPAIGGSAAAAGTFTTLGANTQLNINGALVVSSTLPTISSCGTGGGSSVTGNSSASFRVQTPNNAASACTLTFPTAAHGWNCVGQDVTTTANAWMMKQTGGSTTTAVMTNYNAGTPTNWTASDVLAFQCTAY